MRSDQLQRRSRHRDPDIDEHEVYWSIDLFECFAQIAFAQFYEWAESRLLEVGPGGGGLCWLVFRADDHATAAGSRYVVTHCGGKIDRRNSIGRANFDDPTGVARATKQVAEFSLVPIERD